MGCEGRLWVCKVSGLEKWECRGFLIHNLGRGKKGERLIRFRE